MDTFSIKLPKEKIALIKKVFKDDIKKSPNEYIDTFISRDDLTISIYTSDKVVFQGKDAFFFAQDFIDVKKQREAGSDEVGTGDYIGPVIVCAAIVEENDYEYITKLGITDSKQMTDEKILQIGKEVMNKFKHSLLILDNEKYNSVHETNNLNAIKAKMHNQAYLNLINKSYELPKACYVDQFCPENAYYEYLANEKDVYHNLIFETKAESNHPSVAVASVIARYAFLNSIESLSKEYGINFHKGAGEDVNNDIKEFISKYGKDKLNKIVKLHFKNTENL